MSALAAAAGDKRPAEGEPSSPPGAARARQDSGPLGAQERELRDLAAALDGLVQPNEGEMQADVDMLGTGQMAMAMDVTNVRIRAQFQEIMRANADTGAATQVAAVDRSQGLTRRQEELQDRQLQEQLRQGLRNTSEGSVRAMANEPPPRATFRERLSDQERRREALGEETDLVAEVTVNPLGEEEVDLVCWSTIPDIETQRANPSVRYRPPTDAELERFFERAGGIEDDPELWGAVGLLPAPEVAAPSSKRPRRAASEGVKRATAAASGRDPGGDDDDDDDDANESEDEVQEAVEKVKGFRPSAGRNVGFAPVKGRGKGKGKRNTDEPWRRLPDDVWVEQEERQRANLEAHLEKHDRDIGSVNPADLMNLVYQDVRFAKMLEDMGFTVDASWAEEPIRSLKDLPANSDSLRQLDRHIFMMGKIQETIDTIRDSNAPDGDSKKNKDTTRLNYLERQLTAAVEMTGVFRERVLKAHAPGGADAQKDGMPPITSLNKRKAWNLLMESQQRQEKVRDAYEEGSAVVLLKGSASKAFLTGEDFVWHEGEYFNDVDDLSIPKEVREAMKACNNIWDKRIPVDAPAAEAQRVNDWYVARRRLEFAWNAAEFEGARLEGQLKKYQESLKALNAKTAALKTKWMAATQEVNDAKRALEDCPPAAEIYAQRTRRIKLVRRVAEIGTSDETRARYEEELEKTEEMITRCDKANVRALNAEEELNLLEDELLRSLLSQARVKRYKERLQNVLYEGRRKEKTGAPRERSKVERKDRDRRRKARLAEEARRAKGRRLEFAEEKKLEDCEALLAQIRAYVANYKAFDAEVARLKEVRTAFEKSQIEALEADYKKRKGVIMESHELAEKELKKLEADVEDSGLGELMKDLREKQDALQRATVLLPTELEATAHDGSTVSMDYLYRLNERYVDLETQAKAAEAEFDAWKNASYTKKWNSYTKTYPKKVSFRRKTREIQMDLANLEAELESLEGVDVSPDRMRRMAELPGLIEKLKRTIAVRKKADGEYSAKNPELSGKTTDWINRAIGDLRQEHDDNEARAKAERDEADKVAAQIADIRSLIDTVLETRLRQYRDDVARAEDAVGQRSEQIAQKIKDSVKLKKKGPRLEKKATELDDQVASLRQQLGNSVGRRRTEMEQEIRYSEAGAASLRQKRDAVPAEIIDAGQELQRLKQGLSGGTDAENKARIAVLQKQIHDLELRRVALDDFKSKELGKFLEEYDIPKGGRPFVRGLEKSDKGFQQFQAKTQKIAMARAPQYFEDERKARGFKNNAAQRIVARVESLKALDCDDESINDIVGDIVKDTNIGEGRLQRASVDLIAVVRNSDEFKKMAKEHRDLRKTDEEDVAFKKFLEKPKGIGTSVERYEERMMLLDMKEISDLAQAGSGRARHYFRLLCKEFDSIKDYEDLVDNQAKQLDPTAAEAPSSLVEIADRPQDCSNPDYSLPLPSPIWNNLKASKQGMIKYHYTRLVRMFIGWESMRVEQRGGSWPDPRIARDLAENARLGADHNQPTIDDVTGEVKFISEDDYELTTTDRGEEVNSDTTIAKYSCVPWVTLSTTGQVVPVDTNGMLIRESKEKKGKWQLEKTAYQVINERFREQWETVRRNRIHELTSRDSSVEHEKAKSWSDRRAPYRPNALTNRQVRRDTGVREAFASREPQMVDFLSDQGRKQASMMQKQMQDRTLKQQTAVEDEIRTQRKDLARVQAAIAKDEENGTRGVEPLGNMFSNLLEVQEIAEEDEDALGELDELLIRNPRSNVISISLTHKAVMLRMLISSYEKDLARMKAMYRQSVHGIPFGQGSLNSYSQWARMEMEIGARVKKREDKEARLKPLRKRGGLGVDGNDEDDEDDDMGDDGDDGDDWLPIQGMSGSADEGIAGLEYLRDAAWMKSYQDGTSPVIERVIAAINTWLRHYYGPAVNQCTDIIDYNERIRPWLLTIRQYRVYEFPLINIDMRAPEGLISSLVPNEKGATLCGPIRPGVIGAAWIAAHRNWYYGERQGPYGGGLRLPPGAAGASSGSGAGPSGSTAPARSGARVAGADTGLSIPRRPPWQRNPPPTTGKYLASKAFASGGGKGPSKPKLDSVDTLVENHKLIEEHGYSEWDDYTLGLKRMADDKAAEAASTARAAEYQDLKRAMQDSVRAGREVTSRKKKFMYVGASEFREEDLEWKRAAAKAWAQRNVEKISRAPMTPVDRALIPVGFYLDDQALGNLSTADTDPHIQVSWSKEPHRPFDPTSYEGPISMVPDEHIDNVIEALALDRRPPLVDYSVLVRVLDASTTSLRRIIVHNHPPAYFRMNGVSITRKFTSYPEYRRKLALRLNRETGEELGPDDALPSFDKSEDEDDDAAMADLQQPLPNRQAAPPAPAPAPVVRGDDDSDSGTTSEEEEEDDDEEDEPGAAGAAGAAGDAMVSAPVPFFGEFDPGEIRLPHTVVGTPILPAPFPILAA